MTWNVQHANAARSRRQADWIAAQPVDAIVLTEVSANYGGTALVESLTDHGFTICCPTDHGTDYRTLVASRIGHLEHWPEVRTGHLPHRCTSVRLHLDGDRAVGILGLYVPSRGSRQRRNVDKRAFQNAVSKLLPQLQTCFALNGPVLIAGDLNVVEPDHNPPHKVFGAWEYDFYRAFAGAGFTDAFRHLHPERLDHSWYGHRSGAGYRFDHLFCSDSEVIEECEYHHHPRRIQLSDHSAMTIRISTR